MDLKQTVEDPPVGGDKLVPFTPPEPTQNGNGNGHLNGNGQVHGAALTEEEIQEVPYDDLGVRLEGIVKNYEEARDYLLGRIATARAKLAARADGAKNDEAVMAEIATRWSDWPGA